MYINLYCTVHCVYLYNGCKIYLHAKKIVNYCVMSCLYSLWLLHFSCLSRLYFVVAFVVVFATLKNSHVPSSGIKCSIAIHEFCVMSGRSDAMHAFLCVSLPTAR